MRHHDRKRKLGRVRRQRVALLRSLARSLIIAGGITTTTAKAKALRPFVERLITTSKRGTLASTRIALSRLGTSDTAGKLREIAARYAKRPGGYTRIVRLGRVGKRVGEMARIEFVSESEK